MNRWLSAGSHCTEWRQTLQTTSFIQTDTPDPSALTLYAHPVCCWLFWFISVHTGFKINTREWQLLIKIWHGWVNNMKLPTSWPFSEAMSIINTARAQYLQDYIHNLQHGLELLTALMKLLTHNKNIKCIYFHENLILCIKLSGVLPPLYDEIQKIS